VEAVARLQQEIESLDELRGIVRTMKVMSATSVRQYERAVRSLDTYYRAVELGLQVVLRDIQALPPAARADVTPRTVAVVFGSDHGMCGRFNEDIADHALRHLGPAQHPPSSTLLLAVGARVAGSLEQLGQALQETFFVPGSASRITATVQDILLEIDECSERRHVPRVEVYFNRHLPEGGYRCVREELLPIAPERFRQLRERPWPSRRLPVYDMDRERLLSALLRQYLFVSVFRACAESQACEHLSRLSAMQSAERNLEERLEEVTTSFRRARQGAITAELLEVVSGFEVLTRPDPGA
jgi:F-type H+-transporting ATPase subunit gamma